MKTMKNEKKLKLKKVGIFVDPRITDGVIDDLKSWKFLIIEEAYSLPCSRQPFIEFKGKKKDIEKWAGEFNRFGITSEDIMW